MKEQRRYISNDGEIVSERISEFSEAINDEGYRFPSHKLGARMFSDVQFPREMRLEDVGAMAIISRHYLVGTSNMIGYREGRSIKPYTGPEIGELVHMPARTGRRFIAKMLRLRVMQRVITNSGPQFYVNPAYFMRSGQRLTLDLFLLFRDDLTPLVPKWAMHEFLRMARDKAPLSSDAQAEAERIVGRR